MNYYDETDIPVCDDCKSLDKKLKQCHRCDRIYCKHFSSDIDADKYCSNCMRDVRVKRYLVIKKVELRHEITQEFIARNVGKCIMTRLEGEDYIFAEYRISSFSTEEEFDKAIEYHGAMKSLLVSSREDMRRAKLDRMKGVKIVHSTPVATTKKKRVTSVQITQDPNQIRTILAAALMTQLKRMPTEQEVDAAMMAMAAIKTGS